MTMLGAISWEEFETQSAYGTLDNCFHEKNPSLHGDYHARMNAENQRTAKMEADEAAKVAAELASFTNSSRGGNTTSAI